jgi:hypothetical protein
MAACVLTFAVAFSGCQSAKYAMWEKLGKEKRHLLKDEVEKTAGEQRDASRQFQDALSRIESMYGFDGEELETVYRKLSADYESCLDQAAAVRDRIGNVEQIANDLFAEWESELSEIGNSKLRAESRRSLGETRKRYKNLHAAMKRAEKSMDPVLANFKDYVLYLKHNLNARAVGALKKEADDIGKDISSLIEQMNRSIKEAEAFVKEL